MRKILTILFLLTYSVLFGQDITPISPNFKLLQSPSFSYYIPDSTVWIHKGSLYGWTKLTSKKDLIDTLKYYVPYVNANKELNLNTQNIKSSSQNLPINIGTNTLPTLTKNIDGTVTIGNDGIATFNTLSNGSGDNIRLNCTTGATLTPTIDGVSYIYADYNNKSPIYNITTNNYQFFTNAQYVPIVRVTRIGNILHFEEYGEYGTQLAPKQLFKDITLNSIERSSGLILSTTPTRIVSVSAGVVWMGIQYYATTTNTSGSLGTLYEYYLVNGVWNSSAVTSYDASYYSDGTNRQSLSANKFVSKYFFRDAGDDNEVYYIHGNQYNKEIDAYNELLPSTPLLISSHSIYVGKIVIETGSNNGTAYHRIWDESVQSQSSVKHDDLTDLVWHISGHIGDINTIASFDSNGTATNTTTGDLTENINGIEFSNTRKVIGGATTLTITPGYTIPTTSSITTYDTAYTHSQNDADLSSTNELNQSLSFDVNTKNLTLIDAGGTKTTTININVGNVVNTYMNKIGVTTSTISVTWPQNFSSNNYFLSINPYYIETINGKSVRMSNAVYDFSKTISGFSLKLDTVAGFVEYFAADTTNLYPLQFNNYIPTASITTTVSNPGLDTNIPTEKAVRTVVETNKMVYPSAGIAVSTGSTWGTSLTDNSTNWNTAYSWGNHTNAGYKLISDSTLASGYATVHRLNGKEPVFSKNTAFNKNFGSTGGTVTEGNDSRLSDTRTPTNASVSYNKIANDLASSGTVTSTINLSANSIGYITLSANTAFSFSNYQLGKTYILIVTSNGFTPSFLTSARHVFVTGNETLGTSGVFYIHLTCIDATSGSEKLLTTIMKGA